METAQQPSFASNQGQQHAPNTTTASPSYNKTDQQKQHKVEEDSSEPEVPQFFGNYERLYLVGRGSTCIVYLCKNIKTEKVMACKCVNRQYLVQENLFMRFDQEVRIVQSLHHPHILDIVDLIFDDKFIYMISEYCSNGSLFKYLTHNGPFFEGDAKHIFFQIVDALEFIHSKGIAHRDIKPENILLDGKMNVKLCDFGLCYESCTHKLLSTACGTSYYMAPEIVRLDMYDGKKADLWSLGVVLYTMVTGSLPWSVITVPGLFEKILKAEYTISKSINDEVGEIIRNLIVVDPNQRWTINELKKSLWSGEELDVQKLKGFQLNGSEARHWSKSLEDTLQNDPLMPKARKAVIIRPQIMSQQIPMAPSAIPVRDDFQKLIRKVPLRGKRKLSYNSIPQILPLTM